MTKTSRGPKLPAGVHKRTGARGAVYRVRWFDHAGKRRSRTFDNLGDARDCLEQERARAKRITAGLEAPPRPPAPTVRQLATLLLRRPPATWSAKHRQDVDVRLKRHVLPAFGQQRVDELQRGDVLDLRDELAAPKPDGAGLTVGTVNKVLSALSIVLDRAVAKGYCDSNPCRGRGVRLSVPERAPRTLEAAEAARVLAHVEPVYRGLVAAAVLTGARWGELTALRWADVDLARSRLHIHRSGSRDRPKNGRERWATMPDELRPHLEEIKRALYDGAEPPGDHLVFRRADRHRRRRSEGDDRHPWCPRACPRTDRLSAGGPIGALARACEAAGVSRPTFHGLRHTHVSIAIENGVPPGAVRDQVGHSDLSTLNRYLRGFGKKKLRTLTLAGAPRVTSAEIVAAVEAGDFDRAAELAAMMRGK